MPQVFHISEAGALALHAAVYLAKYTERPCSARELTNALGGSAAHLVKVLQWMARAGLVHTERGPRGGYALTARAKRATIRAVIEAVEGPMTTTTCLLKHKACRGNACMMSDLLKQINRQVMEYVSQTPISTLTPAFARAARQRKKKLRATKPVIWERKTSCYAINANRPPAEPDAPKQAFAAKTP